MSKNTVLYYNMAIKSLCVKFHFTNCHLFNSHEDQCQSRGIPVLRLSKLSETNRFPPKRFFPLQFPLNFQVFRQ